MSKEPSNEEIIKALRNVEDPEMHIDIHTLGLIYDIKMSEHDIEILMTLTTPFCPYANEIVLSVRKALEPFGLHVQIEVTFEPEWAPPEDVRIALGI